MRVHVLTRREPLAFEPPLGGPVLDRAVSSGVVDDGVVAGDDLPTDGVGRTRVRDPVDRVFDRRDALALASRLVEREHGDAGC